MVTRLLRACGREAMSKRLSPAFARVAARAFETIYKALGKQQEPPLTSFLVEQLSTAHWFSINAAKRDLGYQPKVSTAEGLKRLQEWWQREGRMKSGG